MKTTLSTLLLAATLCASGFVTRPVRAQAVMFQNLSGNLAMTNLMLQPIHRQAAETLWRSQNAQTVRRGENEKRGTTRIKAAKALTTTTYRESPAVTKRVLTRFTNWIATKANASDAASIRRDFENDMLGRWAKEVRENGLKRGDVADALTAYWLTNWMIANRVTSDPTRAQVRAVRRFFASALSSTPAFAKATNAQRQEMAEGCIYNAVLQGGAFGQAFHTGDKALIKRYSDARAASFKTETGLDLRAMKLTDAGFAAKG